MTVCSRVSCPPVWVKTWRAVWCVRVQKVSKKQLIFASLMFKQSVRNEVQFLTNYWYFVSGPHSNEKSHFCLNNINTLGPIIFYVGTNEFQYPRFDSYVILANLSFLWFLVCVQYACFLCEKRSRNAGPSNILKFTKTLWLAWMFWRVWFWPLKNK